MEPTYQQRKGTTMARQEHLDRLNKGVDHWNQWRQQDLYLLPDLSGAYLSDTDLSRANLSNAILNRAVLNGAKLNGAKLSGAKLSGAKLSRAILSGVDLSGADLSGADLHNAKLSNANLSDTDLSHAIFSGANLSDAHLIGAILTNAILSNAKLNDAKFSDANLSGAILSSADLSGAIFSNADLSGANLSRTILSDADFSDANLSEADLSGAILSNAHLRRTKLSNIFFCRTIFAWVDLSSVRGLETAKHRGPSTVNINSVIPPHDEPTRLHFLRGVGFTETQIGSLPCRLSPRPAPYYSLFISYAHQDEALAQQLHTHLRQNDIPCWFAPHDVQPSNSFRERIDQVVYRQDNVLLLFSQHSLNNGWVRYEVELALARETRELREILFPIRLDDTLSHCKESWATSLQATRHIGNFTHWRDDAAYQQAFATLLRHLKGI
jgi:uncharacterized protein YjbI with pentapeptide repeats